MLILTPLMEASFWSVGGAVAAFIVGVILLVMGISVGDGVFDAVMERNLGPRLGDLRKRVENSYPFCIEDTATYQRLKVISEDYATGGFDRRTSGLLLEGIRYRYIIRPGDLTEFRVHGDHRIVTVTIGRSSLSVALNIAMGDDEKEREAYALLDKIFKPVE